MSFSFFLSVLRSRKWLILLTAALTVAAALYFAAQEPARYSASTSLIINFSSENPFEDYRLPAQLADSFLATQVDIIGSRSVALQVAEQAGVADGEAEAEQAVTRILRNLDVETSRESRVITITYEANDPVQAANYANLIAQSYMNTANRLSIEPSERNAQVLTQQLESMRTRLEEAQKDLSKTQKDQGITALDERLDSENMRLAELSNQLVAAQSRTYDARSRQLGVNHPDYVAAVKSEASVQAALEEQKQRVLSLRQRRDELAVVSREVGIEQEAYEGALTSYYQQTLQSRLGGVSVAILDPATPPARASNPPIAINVAGSILLGLILGVIIGILSELLLKKVRSRDDVADLIEHDLVHRV